LTQNSLELINMPKIVVATLLICCVAASSVWARDKTDVIWLANGDRISGEIKKLEHGQLTLSTDSMGSVLIEWADILRMESSADFQFESSDGKRIFGKILTQAEPKTLKVAGTEPLQSFAYKNIVRISQLESDFWSQLHGSLSFGYSFTKASNVAQGNLAFSTSHRTEDRSFSLSGSTIITSDQQSVESQRSDLDLTMTRFRTDRWFNKYSFGFESNDQLGLDLRTSLGAGLGRYLIQTNTAEFAVMGGVVGTSESLALDASDATSDSTQQNIEGMLGMEYAHYLYNHPSIDVSASYSAFPSITDRGRLRTQLDLNLRWEVLSDLYWDLSFYRTDDDGLESSSESTSDHGIVTSIGYSY
jgi:hypothetical protein